MATSSTPSPGAWPSLTRESVVWHFSDEAHGAYDWRDVSRLDGRPYDASVVPAIATLDPRAALPARAIEDITEAQSEVASFERESASLPVPMPAVLLRSESASSSQIENLTANARNLARAMIGVRAGRNARDVAGNVAAMTQALASRGPLTAMGILGMHEALLAGIEPSAGQFRREPVWIGRRAISPHGAEFVPPRWERVIPAIDDLTAFAQAKGIAPLMRAAIAHAQFETIHPFTDGNGRTGRAMVHGMLRADGLVARTTVPVSAGLLADVGGYIESLTAYRAGDIEPIVSTFADAARWSVANGRMLSAQIATLRETWASQIRARSDAIAWRLADALFAQPVITSAYVVSELGVTLRGALNAIETLVGAGVLSQSGQDRRIRVWQADGVLHAMDEFADRARRGRL